MTERSKPLGTALRFEESTVEQAGDIPTPNGLTFAAHSPYAFRVPDDPRSKNALLIAASLIAAVRTAKEEKIDQSPRVISRISDSVKLAKMVLRRIEREEEGI